MHTNKPKCELTPSHPKNLLHRVRMKHWGNRSVARGVGVRDKGGERNLGFDGKRVNVLLGHGVNQHDEECPQTGFPNSREFG